MITLDPTTIDNNTTTTRVQYTLLPQSGVPLPSFQILVAVNWICCALISDMVQSVASSTNVS